MGENGFHIAIDELTHHSSASCQDVTPISKQVKEGALSYQVFFITAACGRHFAWIDLASNHYAILFVHN